MVNRGIMSVHNTLYQIKNAKLEAAKKQGNSNEIKRLETQLAAAKAKKKVQLKKG